MALSFHCPRCLKRLPFATDMLGQQVTCTACQLQFALTPAYLHQSDDDSAATAPTLPAPTLPSSSVAAPTNPKSSVAAPTRPVPTRPASTSPPQMPVASGSAASARATSTHPPQPPPVQHAGAATVVSPVLPSDLNSETLLAEPPQVVLPQRATTAEVTTRPQSSPNARSKVLTTAPITTLKPAADGSLPTLALEQSLSKKDRPARQPPSSLAVMGALGLSVVLSFALWMVDFDNSPPVAPGAFDARQKLVKFLGNEGEPLQPYQILLRESQLAHYRGDLKSEREAYRSVLRLLRSEDRGPRSTVTGATYDDAELEATLTQLLREIADRSFLGLN